MNPSSAEPCQPARRQQTPRILLADRGDPLVGALSTAMRQRFDVVAQLDTELSAAERLLVAATTFTPTRRLWAERFYKSNLGVSLRSRRARHRLAATVDGADVVFQTHALFEVADPRTVMYVDCTHRQSMEQWPDWNPLHGRALERWLVRERRQYQQSAHVFAFSAETARSVVADYDVAPHRVTAVGAGVSLDRLPVLGQPFDRPPTVLFVGNDFERKGGRRLLEAFALVRRRIPNARLRIVGTAARIPAQDGVEQVGRVHSRGQMSRLFASADVFCLPSYFDPFPGALLEAMAHGLPSVVTRTCGVPEIIEEGVTAVSVGRGASMTAELADALEHLLTHADESAEMGLQARWRVADRFQWSHVLDRMAPVLQAMTRGASPTSPAPTSPAPTSPAPGDRRPHRTALQGPPTPPASPYPTVTQGA